MVAESATLHALLERFVFDNPELERLEAILDDFNPFVALRWTRQEVRHSAFLRWLLDPSETHGLGPYFLRGFWKRVAYRSSRANRSAPTVVNIDSWDLSGATVLQEWRGIDLLVHDDTNRFIGVVENKIDTFEHTNQLRRYRTVVEQHFPRHRQLFAYLTATGEEPSDDVYAKIEYSEIVTLVEDTLQRRSDQLSSEVRSFLAHYVQMIRRHIVEESEIQELCQAIYRKHRKALDVLFEHRPDRASEVRDILVESIEARKELVQDHSSKTYIRFLPRSLDFLPRLGDGWTRSKRMLLFEFNNANEQLSLKLILGPGEQGLRDRIYRLIAAHPEIFNRARQTLYPQWWSFDIEKWLTPQQYSELEAPDLKKEIDGHLERFLADRLPKMGDVFTQLREDVPPNAYAGDASGLPFSTT